MRFVACLEEGVLRGGFFRPGVVPGLRARDWMILFLPRSAAVVIFLTLSGFVFRTTAGSVVTTAVVVVVVVAAVVAVVVVFVAAVVVAVVVIVVAFLVVFLVLVDVSVVVIVVAVPFAGRRARQRRHREI